MSLDKIQGFLTSLLDPVVALFEEPKVTTFSSDSIAVTGNVTVRSFLGQLSVSPVEGSRVISVEFTSVDPVKASILVNGVVDEYITSRLDAKFDMTRQASAWLDERVGDLRDSVSRSEMAVEQARQEFGLVDSGGGTLLSQERAELNSQLIIANADVTSIEARLRIAESLAESSEGVDSAVEVLDSALIQNLRQEQTALARQLAELSTEYGELHPRMIQLRAQAEDLDGNVNIEVAKIVTSLRNQLTVAETRVDSLSESLDEIKGRFDVSNQQDIGVRALEREAQANSVLLATLLNRQKETLTQQDEGFQQADARVIAYADIPQVQSYPKIGVMMGLVLIASILVGLILILFLELLDRRFYSGEQLERVTGVTSLGIIPNVKKLGRQRLAKTILDNPRSAFSESIRTLNWSISLGFENSKPPKVILITSANPGEGKSTVATSLALSQAAAGQKVLLIDADTRWPSVHELIETPVSPGLTDVLVGNCAAANSVAQHKQSGLGMLTAGDPIPDPSSLFGSDKMEAALDYFRSKFDLIIIDTPPIMACSDARVLSRWADATVMIVRFAKTQHEVVKLCVRQLRSSGTTMAGILLTDVNLKKYATYDYGESGAYSGVLAKYYGG